MAATPDLCCLAPALLGPVPSTLADATASAGPFELLEYLLGRARRHTAEPADGETLIRHRVVGAPPPGALLASAFDIAPERSVYRAAPVHLRADRDRLLLFAGDGLDLTETESASICADFNRLFGADGLALARHNGEWLLSAEKPPGPSLPALRSVAGQYLDTVIPNDSESRPWRQLLNEAQMFLFDHPVNTAREARGELTANGLWFWGGGRAEPTPPTGSVDWIIADDPFAGAVAGALQVPVSAPGAVTRAELAAASRPVIVWSDAERALLGGDVHGWLAALQAFEQGWAPRLRDLAITHGRRVVLDTGAGTFVIDRGAQRRFWRRHRPLGDWMARE